jgi:2-keto-4-pentenoate hydratase/2-oxohepta-3-ene-1,7-dioic acid hydratase in catechol pathway
MGIGLFTLPPGTWGIGTFATGAGPAFPGVVVGSRVRDVSHVGSTTFDILQSWDQNLELLRGLAADNSGEWVEVSTLQTHAPLVPGEVLQSGANYRRHVIELVAREKQSVHGATPEEARADAQRMMDARARDGKPYVFLGTRRAITGAFDPVILPSRGVQHDWELELALIIGKPARHVSVDNALSYVAGYTIANDISTRDELYRPDLKAIGTDWFTCKNAPTFLPLGPVIVPAEFVADPQDLTIRLEHNGVVRQDESTADMIFSAARLISFCSQITELLPGDLILTGSPAGNGAQFDTYLKDGDVMDSTITGLGAQHNPVTADFAVSTDRL